MHKKLHFIIVSLLFTTLIIGGCRVRDAGEDREPTEPGSQRLVANQPTDDTGTLPGQTPTETTPVAGDNQTLTPDITAGPTETLSPSATPTRFVFTATPSPTSTPTFASGPSETPTDRMLPSPTATSPFTAGQGGSNITPTPEEAGPMGEPTLTATLTPQVISVQPSATATDPFTATPTSTSLPPTDTPTATVTASPTDTPTATVVPPSSTPTAPPESPTFTPFPSLTATSTGQAVAQAASATPNSQQQTAQAIVDNLTATAIGPQDGQGGQVSTSISNPTATTAGGTGTTGATGATATLYPDCEYKIAPGDRLSNIAITYNITIQQLIDRNPENIREEGNLIEAGDTIWIPGCGRNPTPTPTGTLTQSALAPGSGGDGSTTEPDPLDNTLGPVEYTVQAGDGIYKLSRVFGVTMREILQANPGISDINLIIEGETITIPTRSQFDDEEETTETATATPASQ